MIKIKASKRSQVTLAEVHGLHLKHQDGIETALYTIGENVGLRTKQLITEGPKTGRVYRIRGADHQASAPGEAPANRTGRLVRSYDYNVHGFHQMEVGEDAPSAGWLEDGTKNANGSVKMAPRPHLIRAINELQGDAINIFYQETNEALR